MNERKLTKAELDKSEEIVMGMKSNKKELIKRYGKKAEEVMYATARKRAKEKTESMEKPNRLSELVKQALMNPKKADLNKDDELSDYEKKRGAAIEKSMQKEITEEYGIDNYRDDFMWADYSDIGQFSMNPEMWNKFSEYDFYLKGKDVVKRNFGGNANKAYDAIVKDAKLEETVTENVSQGVVNKVSRFITSLANYYDYSEQDAVYAIMQALRAHNANFQGLEEDLDLGHEDNEPHMLKGDLYRVGKYAMELYKIMDGLEYKGEIDLPHWWQAKIIKAKDALISAKHYLDFEMKEPQIDAMVDVATEEEAIEEIRLTNYDYPSFQSNRGIRYQDMLISQGYWSYMGKERYGKGQYMNIDNGQIYGFGPNDIEYFKKHLKDIEIVSEEKIDEMIKGAHSVMGDKSKKKKRPSKKDIKLTKDTQADYKKEEEEDYEGLAARSGASLEEDMNDPVLVKARAAEDESLNYYLSNAKNRLKDPHTIEDIEYKKTKRGDKFVKIIYKKKYVPGKMMDTGPHFVSVFYNDEKELQKIGKALDIHDLYESINKEAKEPTTFTIAEKLAKQLKEAKAPKTKEELEAAIEDAERKIEKHAESLTKIDSAPGGGNWSSNSAEGKKERKLKDAQGKLRDKIDTYTKKLKKLK